MSTESMTPVERTTDLATDTDLKPCPFCGGVAERRMNPIHGAMTMIACRQCGASAFHLKWQRRVPIFGSADAIAELVAENERLRALVRAFQGGLVDQPPISGQPKTDFARHYGAAVVQVSRSTDAQISAALKQEP